MLRFVALLTVLLLTARVVLGSSDNSENGSRNQPLSGDEQPDAVPADTLSATSDADTLKSDLSARIDELISARLASENIPAAAPLDDYGFARRITLDLAGRPPTLNELTQFVESSSANKRQDLTDRLLQAQDFDFHLRNQLDVLLLAALKTDDGWREYLLEAVRADRGWDQIFTEILLPERQFPDDKRPAAFLQARAADLDNLTNDTSILLFGVNIACAKCHDHPLVGDWQQQHYFGLASFFQRTFATRSGLVSEKFEGQLKFTDVAGEEHPAKFMFLTGLTVDRTDDSLNDDQRKDINRQIKESMQQDEAGAPPLPEFSPRAELVRLALQSGGDSFFVRNMVNRIWAQLTGYGLVHPLDQLHSENPPSHPQLLQLLADDFADHGYNVRRLIRQIVLSQTYAVSSRWPADDPLPAADLFARAVPRPLTPRQLSLALQIATGHPDQLPGLPAAAAWTDQREILEQQSAAFSAKLPLPADSFQVATEEALLFNNSAQVRDRFLAADSQHLVGWLTNLDDTDQLIQQMFLCVLCRPASDIEQQAVSEYLSQRPDSRTAAVQQTVWALLTSPEFRFNH